MIWDNTRSIFKHANATGSGSAIALTLTPGMGFKLSEVRIKLAAAPSGAHVFTITNDSGIAATIYDCIIYSQDLDGLTNHYKNFTNQTAPFTKDDSLIFASASITGVWGIEVVYEVIAFTLAEAGAKL